MLFRSGDREIRRQAVDDELSEQQHRPEFQAVDERPQVQLVLKVDPSRHPIFVTDAEKLRSEGPLAMSPTPRPADKKPTTRTRGQRRPTLCSRRRSRRSHGQRDRWSRSTRRTSIKKRRPILLESGRRQVNYPALLAPSRLAAVGHFLRAGLSRNAIVPRDPMWFERATLSRHCGKSEISRLQS